MDGRDQMNDRQAQRRKATSGLLQAASLWRRLAERALLAEGISAARADVLIWIGRLGGGLRQVQLAEAIGHTSNALVRLLDELSASDLIERRPDESDRRANRIWLTPQGEELAARAEDVLNVLRDEVLGDMGSEDLAAAIRLYETIAEAANGQAEARNASLLAS
jgi:MarR family transcriptional regulator for hemolysin